MFLITHRSTAADLPTAQLSVESTAAASDCPDEQTMAAAVRSQLASQRYDSPTEPLSLHVTMDKQADEYAAVIRVDGRKQGVRTLVAEGPSCAGLADAVIVTLALLLDKDLFPTDPTSAAPSSAPPAPPPASPAPEPAPLRVWPAPAAQPPTTGWLSVGAAVTSGLPYGLSGATMVDAGVGWKGWFGSLGGLWAPSREVTYAPGSVDIGLMAAELRGCRRLLGESKHSQVSICGQLLAGQLTGRGGGYADVQVRRRPWLAGGLSAEAGGPLLWRFYWSAFLGGTSPFWHETFSVQGLGRAYHPALVSFVAGGRLQAKIW